MSNWQDRESSSLSRLDAGPSSAAMIAGRSLGSSEPSYKRARRKPKPSVVTPAVTAYDGERLLPIKVVAAVTSWSRTSINRLVAEGKFPTPVKLGHKIAFRESEIRAYVEAQQRRSDAALHASSHHAGA